ncbi:TPA: DMT family transporter [Staphylococcus aureus]|uniref:DMT family transporter n=1 Tax=Staphylococcus aureus TaxID=1280 RepID=UPI0001DA1FEA|nr:DMT family transporter [Staphylococcus aureus]ADI98505.1 Permease of the drug/metabolite transporter (DMT) superfamily [Staphylococcus aureus subsp. aureus ED133]AXU09069.1 Permease of the drug/metabolite transporter (DMT) superfamily [Staphylococcus aureus]AZH10556.1 DMT family transporter [Staphylococcus aureus]MBY6737958.1 DMT family transporter [Staphylococcus aureus]MBZ5364943.1 DMT family transporter [Staphylococcus aureus]
MNYLMYLFCMFIWGLNFIAVKIQGDSLPLEVALLYRSLIAFSLFGVMFIFIFKKLKLNNTNWFTIIGFGLCNFTISYLLLYYGTFYSSAAIVTLIFSMKAILTPIFISMVFKRKISNRIYIGGGLGVVSVVVILYPDLNSLTNEFIIGVAFALLGAIITSIGDVLSLYNSESKVHPVLSNTIGMLSAVIFLLIYTSFNGYRYSFPLELNFWFSLLYLSILASFLAWFFYLKLINNIGAAESGYMVAMFPAIGGIASVIMGETHLSINLVVGIILACMGAYLALYKPKPS